MSFIYPAIFHEEDSSYWVDFPAMEGCQTFGDTVNNTMASAQEALSAYLLTLLEDGSELPKPSDIHSIKASDGFTSFVSCDIVPNIGAKAVKKTLSIPEWMNERAVAMGINFSKTLQDALLAKLQAK